VAHKTPKSHRFVLPVMMVAGGALSGAHAGDFATSVVDYTPAPGINVNNSVFNESSKALGPPAGVGVDEPDNSKVVTLGGFGGSITLAFDAMVEDDPANPLGLDAIVFGNSFWVSGDPTRRWAECAHIEISLDANGNGLADDAWFLIPGSHLPAAAQSAWREQLWDDDGATPTPPEYVEDYPDPANFPGIGPSYTTAAYELPPEFATVVLEHPDGAGAMVEAHWGYADLSPTLALPSGVAPEEFYTVPDDPMTVGVTPGSGGGDAFDIAWAVDPQTGAPANLPGFHFIRITSAIQHDAGIFGELSAEIGGVADVRPGLLGDINGDGVVDTADLGLLIGVFGSADTGADLNADGIVDTADLGLLIGAFGSGGA